MITIGILGGIASGKTTISNYFKKNNIKVLHADNIVHELLTTSIIKDKINNIWPEVIIENEVSRKNLAGIVFKNQEELLKLQEIIFPFLNEKILEFYNNCKKEENFIVLDIPLLVETGWNNYCDYLIFKQCHKNLRIQRFAKRNNYELIEATQELNKRENLQFPLEMKEKMANFTVFDLRNYEEQIGYFLKKVKEKIT